MPVMLQNISANPLPAPHTATANAARNASSRAERDGNSDNNFSNALRGAREDNDRDADAGQPVKPADPPDRKTELSRKRGSKEEDRNDQSTMTAVPAQVAVQRNDAPLAALLNLVSYRAPAEVAEQPTTDTNATVEANTVEANNVEAVPVIAELASRAKTGDVKEAADTNGRTQDRGHGMTVPFDYYPILQAGTNYGTAAAAAATPAGNKAAAAVAAAPSAPSDPLVIDAPPATDAAAPELAPKNTAFAMRMSPESQQPTKQLETAGSSTTPKFSLSGGPSITALEQAANGDGKSQSNDTSSGHNSAFGMAYTEPAFSSRSASDKPVFSEATTAARTTATDETAMKPATTDPLRNILLQLKSDDNRRIDVRLVERAGELHVAVKSADPVLAERLQQNMPELTSRLEAEHFTHEVWMPKLSEAGRSESGSNSDNTSAGSNGQSGQAFNGETGRRQHGQSQSRPDWVDLLENQIG